MNWQAAAFVLIASWIPFGAHSGEHTNLLTLVPPLPHCGEIESSPFANPHDAGSRTCPAVSDRTYVPRHKGIEFDLLKSESEACFVPDQEFRLLDEIVDAVSMSLQYDPNLSDPNAEVEQARAIGKRISQELTLRGFGLYIPTETLSDALIDRNQPGEAERHVFDCDTGSFIFLTVTEGLGAETSLVDTILPSGKGHNYVQWRLDKHGTSMNWDTNQQGECITPPGQPNYLGKAMTPEETKGYALALRAELWAARGSFDRALADFHAAMRMYSKAPIGYNNLAWMVATKDFADRKKEEPEALKASQRAVSINRTANYLDTLACVHALMGNFTEAIAAETEAISLGRDIAFDARLLKFQAHQDCTGEK